MNKPTIALLGAFITTLSGAANATGVIHALQAAGVKGMDQTGKMELSVDQLYGVTQVAQKAGLEISVLGTSETELGKVKIQIGQVNKMAPNGVKVFTPQTINDFSMFRNVVYN